MSRRVWFSRSGSAVCLAAALAVGLARPGISTVLADETRDRVRAQLLEQMGALAQQTTIRFVEGTQPPELNKTPVFRYDDQPRRFIDATMWVWTQAGRPVAFEKIEARNHIDTGLPQWGYCFTSTAAETLSVEWGGGRRYRTTEPGLIYREVPSKPDVAARPVERKRQLRELARNFAAKIILNPRTNSTEEMRLLATPIFEYADPESKLPQGAVFAFSTNGTNPDLLVLFEARGEDGKQSWHFAPVGMTTGGVIVRYQDEKVWEAPFVSPHDGPFAAWMFFATPRTSVEGEEQR